MSHRIAFPVAALVAAITAAPALAQRPTVSCESLAMLSLPNTTITAARQVAAGAFTLPPAPAGRGQGQAPPRFDDLPAFCRVEASVRPTADSDIRIEVWLPAAGWTGHFQPVGNGLWGGGLGLNAMANVLRSGAATAATDTGHQGAGAAWAIGHPEKVVDFGERSFHEMTVKAKALMRAYYGSPPRLSYVNECGGGSRQGLKEAQRFPDDFDAIAAGGLANYTTRHAFGQLWVWQATHKDAASFIPPAKYPAMHQAALDACDARDGVKDGVILDPPRCAFNPAVLQCKGEDTNACLTAPQVEAARKIYTPPTNPRTGETLFGGLMPGSELGWTTIAGSDQPFGFGTDFFRYLVFKDPAWDPRTLNFDSHVALADAPPNKVVDAWDPDISKLIARGGKLLMFGGWSDTAIAPALHLDYYEAVVRTVGAARARDAVRLFMIPGMGHCPGTNGALNYNFDSLKTLLDWKATGTAPDQIIATEWRDGKETRKVLVCAHPRLATYRGSGSTDDPANYACRDR